MNCSACCDTITEKDDFTRCSVADCNKSYHLLCIGENKLAHGDSDHKSWICPECSCAAKKGGDNSLTPVGHTKKQQNSNVTLRQKSSRLHDNYTCKSGGVSSDLSHEVQELRTEITLLREQITSSNIQTAIYDSKLNQSIALIADYDRKLCQSVSTIKSYETKIEEYVSQIGKLVDKLQQCECSSRISNDAASKKWPLKTQTQTVPLQRRSIATPPSHPPATSELQCKTAVTVKSPAIKQIESDGVQVRKQKLTESNAKVSSLIKPQSVPTNASNNILISTPTEKPDTDDWTEVKKKKNRRPPSLYGAAGPMVTSLKAVEVRKHIHLWNMASGVDDIRDYLRQLCPNGTCTVEELTAKGDYKSYKLGVPSAYYDACFSVDVWPINARIKAWVNYRGPAQKQTSTSSNVEPSTSPRPFREWPSKRATTQR